MIRKIWVMTLFPEYFKPFLECGISGSAFRGERSDERFKFEMHFVNIRDYSNTKYKSVDDSPFGGGPGMVMKAEVLRDALMKGVVEAGGYGSKEELHVVYTSPRGRVWNNSVARDFGTKILAGEKDIVFLCGRYEGVDERFLENYVQDFYSVGDYVLTGGEIPVMAMLDSAVRFVPGILGNKLSATDDSFEDGLIEFPQYTKPREFEGKEVPAVLLEGHHKKIGEWQKEQKITMTKKWRPDLLKGKP